MELGVSVGGSLHKEKTPFFLACFSTLIVHLNNGDPLFGPCKCSLQKNAFETTRCGIVADSFLNCIYSSPSEDYIIHHFDSLELQKMIKTKNLVCKISWATWNKDQFEWGRRTGEFVMPVLEHTYLIDLAPARNPSRSVYAYIIQAAVGNYHCDVQPITSEFLWHHLSFLDKFDRTTILEGRLLYDWVQSNLYPNSKKDTLLLESFEGREFIGQLISFTGYSYDPEIAVTELNTIRTMIDLPVWKDVIDSVIKWGSGKK